METSLAKQSSTTALDGLIDVSASRTVPEYLADLWRLRNFMAEVPRADLRARNMNTLLGNVWYLVSPLLQVGVYFLVFGEILGVDRGLQNFLGYLTIGVFLFRYSQQCAIAGAKSLTTNEGLIKSIRFPRAVLPISAVTAETLALVPALGVAIVITILTGEAIEARWLLFIPYVALLVMFTMGIAFITARLNEMFRDIQNILPIFFRLTFYLSGILYSIDRFTAEPDTPQWVLNVARLFPFNPWYSLITLAKSSILAEVDAPPEIWISAVSWSIVALIGGFLLFKAGESTYGRN